MRFFATVLLVALAGLLPARNAIAQEEVPEQIVLDIPHVQQEGEVWCWLAVSEMVIQYYHDGLSLPQCMMLDVLSGGPPGMCCRNPDSCQLRAHGLEEIQLVIAQFAGHTSTMLPAMPPSVLYGALQSGHVVIAHVLGHVVLIRGMRFELESVETETGPRQELVPYIIYNDPARPVPMELPYVIFARGLVWMRTLVVGD